MSVTCKIGETCGCGFKNTGAEYGEVWNHINQLIDKEVDCEECNAHGHESINGLRDHIKAGIGKNPFSINNYKKFVNEVNCVYNKCVSEGRCGI